MDGWIRELLFQEYVDELKQKPNPKANWKKMFIKTLHVILFKFIEHSHKNYLTISKSLNKLLFIVWWKRVYPWNNNNQYKNPLIWWCFRGWKGEEVLVHGFGTGPWVLV